MNGMALLKGLVGFIVAGGLAFLIGGLLFRQVPLPDEWNGYGRLVHILLWTAGIFVGTLLSGIVGAILAVRIR